MPPEDEVHPAELRVRHIQVRSSQDELRYKMDRERNDLNRVSDRLDRLGQRRNRIRSLRATIVVLGLTAALAGGSSQLVASHFNDFARLVSAPAVATSTWIAGVTLAAALVVNEVAAFATRRQTRRSRISEKQLSQRDSDNQAQLDELKSDEQVLATRLRAVSQASQDERPKSTPEFDAPVPTPRDQSGIGLERSFSAPDILG